MPGNFKKTIIIDGKAKIAIIITQLRKNGMYYEVNIKGFPRFYMVWGALDRYECPDQEELKLPDSLVLAVSDAIEEHERKK